MKMATSPLSNTPAVVTKQDKNGRFYTKIAPRPVQVEKCESESHEHVLSYSEKVKHGVVHLKPLGKELLFRSSSSPLQRVRSSEPVKQLSRSKSGDVHRITYDRNFLLTLRASPLASIPPKDLPEIPGATVPYVKTKNKKNKLKKKLLEKTLSNMSGISLTSVTSDDTIPEVEIERICDLVSSTNLNEN